MKKGIHINPLLVALILFVLVFAGAILGVRQFGAAIQSRLESLAPAQSSQTVTDKPSKRVRRITVLDELGGCIEVTPDGAVRVYKECGTELDNAYRPQDPKYILELFQKVRTLNTSKYSTVPSEGTYITLVVETDQGTETIYIPGSGSGGSPEDIIKTIDNIIEEIPPPTPTPTIVPSATPSLTPSASPSPTQPGSTWTPTPTTTGAPSGPPGDPFTCVFEEDGTNKPYRVSNVVCSTEPIPAQ